MRGDMVAFLLYEAKVKPAVAMLVDLIDSMSYADIDNAVVPLPWYRIALKLLKDQKIKQKQTEQILANSIYSVTPDPEGWMAEYNGETAYFSISEASEIEVKSGTLVWFPYDGGVWIETTFCRAIDNRMITLPHISKVTKSEYNRIYRERINRRM